MVDKRIKDLPQVASFTAGDKFVIDGATTRAILKTDAFTNVAISGGTVASVAITGSTMSGGAISGGTISGAASTGGTSSAPAITGGTITGAAISGGTITGLSAPVSGGDAATKAYADALASGLITLPAVRLVTAAVLPNTPTYANGALGVGATLTAGSNAAIVVDGTNGALNDSVLVTNQASAFQNGVYTVTTVGSGAAAWVLTRRTDFDTAAEMLARSYFLVTAGATLAGTSYVLQTTVATVGTTAATFNQFSGTAGALLASNNLSDATNAATARANLYAAPLDALAYQDCAINNDHSVSQENFDNSLTVNATVGGGGFYLSDMNRCYTQGSYSMTWQRQTTIVPPGFRYAGKFTVTGAQGSLGVNDAIHRFQKIEGPRVARLFQGNAGAKSFVVCYAVYASINNQIINVAVANGAEDRNYVFKNTVPATTWTVVGGAIATGDTGGTWLTGGGQVGMIPILILGSGSNTFGATGWNTGSLINTTSDVTNMAATNGATLYEVGPFVFPGTQLPTIAELSKIVRHEHDTMALCRNYYRMSFKKGTVPAQNVGVDTGEYTFPAIQAGATSQRGPTCVFDPPMMKDPLLTLYNPSAANAHVRDRTGGFDCSGEGTVAVTTGWRVGCTGNGSTSVGNVLSVHWTADARL